MSLKYITAIKLFENYAKDTLITDQLNQTETLTKSYLTSYYDFFFSKWWQTTNFTGVFGSGYVINNILHIININFIDIPLWLL